MCRFSALLITTCEHFVTSRIDTKTTIRTLSEGIWQNIFAETNSSSSTLYDRTVTALHFSSYIVLNTCARATVPWKVSLSLLHFDFSFNFSSFVLLIARANFVMIRSTWSLHTNWSLCSCDFAFAFQKLSHCCSSDCVDGKPRWVGIDDEILGWRFSKSALSTNFGFDEYEIFYASLADNYSWHQEVLEFHDWFMFISSPFSNWSKLSTDSIEPAQLQIEPVYLFTSCDFLKLKYNLSLSEKLAIDLHRF